MTSNFLLKWNSLALNLDEAKKITGGVAPSPCGNWATAFTCTSTYELDGDNWTGSGIVCAGHWREATEMTYVNDKNMLGHTPIRTTSVICSAAPN